MVKYSLPFFFYSIFLFTSAIFKKVEAQVKKPNIIFILGDDIGYKTITANGGHRYSTPNLDKMALEGMRFTQCHSAPLCSPSRFMLLTGKYNFRNYTRWGVMDQSIKTMGNLFKDAGYVTGCFGKWQLGGGGSSVKAFGFDNYVITYPFTPDVNKDRLYKSPSIYANDDYWAPAQTADQYGEDIFTDSILHFMERNQSSPFFVFYPMVLAHRPFQPTPDDAAFATWNPAAKDDTAYYKSMIKYMDKKIGQILDKVKSLNLDNNTIIMYAGDNGTATQLTDHSDTSVVAGEKGKPTELGTLVPLIARWSGKIAQDTVNNELVDFTDILPTLSKMAKVNIPDDFGIVDGVDFSAQLSGVPGNSRKWIFDHYHPRIGNNPLKRWAQNETYKLLESNGRLLFYNLLKDIEENKPIQHSILTPEEIIIKQQLQDVLDNYAAQSAPVLFTSSVANITDESAVIGATIADEILSPVIERGTIYNDTSFNTLVSNHPAVEGGTAISAFAQKRSGLLPQHKYYYSGYAINSHDTGYSPLKSFYTLSKSVLSASALFTASSAPNSIITTWSPAVFPGPEATKAGYLLVYDEGTPSLSPFPNGQSPDYAVVNGTIASLTSTWLPATADTFAIITGLLEKTKYNFLLIPYTWDGINVSTYHYFTKGIKTATASPGAIVANISPNPSGNEFSLRIKSNSNENLTITVADLNGKKVHSVNGKSSDTYRFGRNFPSGMYFVTVIQGKSRHTIKCVKLN